MNARYQQVCIRHWLNVPLAHPVKIKKTNVSQWKYREDCTRSLFLANDLLGSLQSASTSLTAGPLNLWCSGTSTLGSVADQSTAQCVKGDGSDCIKTDYVEKQNSQEKQMLWTKCCIGLVFY